MCVECRPLGGRGVAWRLVCCVMSVLLASWGPAWADNVTVNCPGESINAALAGFDKQVPNGVSISGTCTEAVVVDGFMDLQIAGSAVLHRPVATEGPGASALVVRGSKNVHVTGLNFEGFKPDDYPRPVVLIERSNVTIVDCTIHGNVSAGLDIQDHSDVQVAGTTVADNGTGIAAGSSAHVQISNWWPDLSTIENNDHGIAATRGALVEVGLATIQNNRQQGVGASNGAVVNLGAWGWGELIITGNGADSPNGAAVGASDGGIIWIIQPTRIEGNHGSGAAATLGGELYVCCGATPEDTRITGNTGFGIDVWMDSGLFFWGPALVEGNLKAGVEVISAEAFLAGGVLIQGNGDSSDPDSWGGLRVGDNASVNSAATVIDNYGPGVFISTGATVFFSTGTVITGNQGYGVELEGAATAMFTGGATATGNRGFDLVCSSGSVAGAAKGMHPVIGRQKCQTWTQFRGYPTWLEDLLGP